MLSWCWWKNGPPNNSFACWCDLRRYPAIDRPGFWQLWKFALDFKAGFEVCSMTICIFENFDSEISIASQNPESFFIVSIVLLCVCLIVSTYTLFIYHCAIYECKNFSRTEAIISRAIAIMFTKCACGWWEIEVPENTEKIAEHEGSFLIFRQSTIVHYPWFTDHESWRPDMDTLGSFRMVQVLDARNSRSLNFFWKLKKMTGHFTKNSVSTNCSLDSSFMLTCWAD